MIDGDGHVVTSAQFRGRYLLLFFGYTHCPDLCPTTLYHLAQALTRLGPEAADLQPLFISIDPARDTPALVARYAALFSPRIIGLTGSPAQLARLEAAYHVYVGPRDPASGAIAHSDLLFLCGPDGNFITALDGRLPAAALARQLAANLHAGSRD